jgi:2-dehydropantoate 2-reductase
MKILMFGRGVISTQYAWAFEKSGHKVEFYVKTGRKAEYGSTVILNILDARKRLRGVPIRGRWSITMVENFNADHDYDLIMVSVQHYDFKNAADFLSGKVGRATILIFNNFWEEPLEQTAKLPADRLVWGFPKAGGGFNDKGVLNGSIFGSIIIGTFGTEPTGRAVAVIGLFKSAGFKSKLIKDFRSWLFIHFVFNAAIQLEVLKSHTSFSLKEMQSTIFWSNTMQIANN